MAAIRVKVGASLDRSVDAVFGQIEKRAARTKAIIQQSLNAGSGRGGPYRAAAQVAQSSYNQIAQAAQRSAQQAQQAQQRSLRLQARGFQQLANVATREMVRMQRSRESAINSFAQRTSHRATRFFWPNAPIASMGRRAAGDILRGAGVDFNLGNSVARSRDLQSRAISLSNQAFQAGAAGPAGIRQDPTKLIAEARAVGASSGIDPAESLAGLEAFVTKTGDLQTGRDILKDMSELAGATGSNLQDTVDAAGDVSNALGDIPNKGAKINQVMRVMAGQGKLGAVEMKDLAKQMAKLSAGAQQFEGDAGENLVKLGALAQFARAKGGAASATQAATSIAGFVNTLKTPARVNKFKAEGIDVFNAKGQIKDPIQLIRDSLATTGGDPMRLKKMFANVIGAKPVEALANVYRGAGGGKAGMAAVDAELKKFIKDAAVGQQEIDESNKRRLESDAAKAQRFQNELDKVVSSMAGKVLPAMERLAPLVLKAADGFGKVVEWAAENPGKAITAAIVASIGRAGLESAFRAGIEKAITGGAGAVGLNTPGKTGSRLMGAGSIGLTVGTIVATSILTEGITNFESGEASMKDFGSKMQAALASGDPAKVEEARRAIQKRQTELENERDNPALGGLTKAYRKAVYGDQTPQDVEIETLKGYVQQLNKFVPSDLQAKGDNKEVVQAVNGLKSGVLQVRVTNPEDIKDDGAKVPGHGRDKPPGP